jgi:hypothetical protein
MHGRSAASLARHTLRHGVLTLDFTELLSNFLFKTSCSNTAGGKQDDPTHKKTQKSS